MASLEGKTSTRTIAAGQVLRADYFRTPPVVGAGDTVRLNFSGDGFSVSASGRALGAAQEGQTVRVQTESGKVVQGIARSGRLVELRL
jgi:flagella basal body P-ring formation protein FlgA